MNLRAAPNLPKTLKGSFLVVDTCALIDAIKTDDFRDLLINIGSIGCELFSIDAVKHEFLRGAKSIEKYAEYTSFLRGLGITFVSGLEQKLDTEDGRTFALIFNKYYENKHTNKQPSYVDMLLLFMVYFYRKSANKVMLLTANHSDVPGFFARNELIVFEENGEIRTEAIYHLDMKRMEKRLDQLLKS